MQLIPKYSHVKLKQVVEEMTGLSRSTQLLKLSNGAVVAVSMPLHMQAYQKFDLLIFKNKKFNELERAPMANVMAALPNIGGALCSTPQSLADAHCWSPVQ